MPLSSFLSFISSWRQGPCSIVTFRVMEFYEVVGRSQECVFNFRLKSSNGLSVKLIFSAGRFCYFFVKMSLWNCACSWYQCQSQWQYQASRDYTKIEHVRTWRFPFSVANSNGFYPNAFFNFYLVYSFLVIRSIFNRRFWGPCVPSGFLIKAESNVFVSLCERVLVFAVFLFALHFHNLVSDDLVLRFQTLLFSPASFSF